MAALCKFCARLNVTNRCLFCGNGFTGTQFKTLTPSGTDASLEEVAVSAVPNVQPQEEKKPKNPFSIAGFVLSLTMFLAVFGLIFSIIGLVKSKSLNGKGMGLGIAGVVIGSLAIVYIVVGACTVFIPGRIFY